MFDSRIFTVLVAVNWAVTVSALEMDPKCLKTLGQGICSTFYADRLSVCLDKMTDASRITWDRTNKKFCLTANAKVCILDKICKSSLDQGSTTASSTATSTDSSTTASSTASLRSQLIRPGKDKCKEKKVSKNVLKNETN